MSAKSRRAAESGKAAWRASPAAPRAGPRPPANDKGRTCENSRRFRNRATSGRQTRRLSALRRLVLRLPRAGTCDQWRRALRGAFLGSSGQASLSPAPGFSPAFARRERFLARRYPEWIRASLGNRTRPDSDKPWAGEALRSRGPNHRLRDRAARRRLKRIPI